MRVSDLLLPDVREALRGNLPAIKELVDELHPVDVADVYLALEEAERDAFLKALPLPMQVRLLEELEDELRAEIVEQIAPDVGARILAEMSADERADLFRDLPDSVAQKLLAKLPREEARDVKTLLSWPEGTAGALMTTDFVALAAELTAAEAIDRIRHVAEEMETVYYTYAVSPEGSLRGVVSLRELVLAKPDLPISEVMEVEHLISVRPETDQEEVARTISKYGLLAVPVIGDAGRLLGIVTIDDIVDVVEQEATEDVQKMAGVVPLEESYFRSSFFRMVQSRAGWLVILFLGELFTGSVLRANEEAFANAMALVYFIPLIVSAGGNTGSQSAGLLIRALALGEVTFKQSWKVAIRETASGLLLGGVLALIGLGRALLWPEVTPPQALVVALAVLFVVLFASVVGALMPIAIKQLGFDPAVSSAPLIATVVDVTGIFLYVQIARSIL